MRKTKPPTTNQRPQQPWRAVMDNPNRKPISTVEFQAIWRKVPSLFEVMMEAIAMGKRTGPVRDIQEG